MKRGAGRQLTKDDPDDEDYHSDDGAGTKEQPRASEEVLKKREIIKVRHRAQPAPSASAAEGASKPTFNFGASAAAPAPVAAPAPAAVNPLLAKFLLKPGQWRCASCDVVNEDEADGKKATKCRACEADRPGHEGKGGASDAAAAPSGGGFTFGSAAPAQDSSSSSSSASVPQFSFGSASSGGGSAGGGFTFGSGTAAAGATSSSFASMAAAGASAGFTFGGDGSGAGAGLVAAAPLSSVEAPKPSVQGEKEASGEEDENTVHKGVAKVYRMHDEKWQECGKGELHVNQADVAGKRSARFVMRADKTHRVVLNAPIPAGLKAVLQNDKFVKFASLDWTQEGAPLSQFLLRFPGKTEATAALSSVEASASFVAGA